MFNSKKLLALLLFSVSTSMQGGKVPSSDETDQQECKHVKCCKSRATQPGEDAKARRKKARVDPLVDEQNN
ncbi:MAG: hypothetical protein LBF25_02680 [Puniceicoccales bacterium]|jgi:hypothetical protein|nr:hypothetical protein [Puniceicoccales bacterium]